MHGHNHGSEGRCGHGARAHHPNFGGHGGHKGGFGPGGLHGFVAATHRMRRGDMRVAILRLLAEQPMHGYQIIQELAARSEGAWNPSAGSVYPTLQLLADEGLIASEETAGKKVFSLTDEGTAAVAEMTAEPAPWEAAAASSDSGIGEYREAAGKLVQVVFSLGKSGTPEQRAAAVEILADARKKLYAILAED